MTGKAPGGTRFKIVVLGEGAVFALFSVDYFSVVSRVAFI
jgi:hypothetical protein